MYCIQVAALFGCGIVVFAQVIGSFLRIERLEASAVEMQDELQRLRDEITKARDYIKVLEA